VHQLAMASLRLIMTDHRQNLWQVEQKVVPRGLEPRTLRLLAVRSNQLSYETSCLSRHQG
jgi:hypothetical protein